MLTYRKYRVMGVIWLRRRRLYEWAQDSWRRGIDDALTGHPPNAGRYADDLDHRTFRIAYDAGYDEAKTKKEAALGQYITLPKVIPAEVWATVLAEALRP